RPAVGIGRATGANAVADPRGDPESHRRATLLDCRAMTEATSRFEGVTPILPVRDLTASLDHYVRVLGFEVHWHHPGNIASVSRGRCDLMFCQGDQVHPGSWVWIGVEDVEPLHEEA